VFGAHALALFLLVGQTEEPDLRRYGDQGSSHAGLILGLGGGSGGMRYAAGAEYGYFVLNGIAPGAEVMVSGGTGLLTTGLLLGTLRLVPVRTTAFSLFVVGRGGRVLLSDHGDGWGVGGGAGIIFFMGGRFGLRVGYDRLELFPRSFCAGLGGGCHVDGIEIGLVVGF